MTPSNIYDGTLQKKVSNINLKLLPLRKGVLIRKEGGVQQKSSKLTGRVNAYLELESSIYKHNIFNQTFL